MNMTKAIGVANVSVNVNTRIRVKLTDYGREIYKEDRLMLKEKLKHIVHYNVSLEPKLDEDGYYCTSMWAFMELFGSHMSIGVPSPIYTTIIVEDAKIGEDYCLEVNEKQEQFEKSQ